DDIGRLTFLRQVMSETLRDNTHVMTRVRNNTRDQAMRASLPGAAVEAIVNTMITQARGAT
ncbi:MAG TPA: hypothetical protein PLQ54_11505, partial [Armatimonadota bacterium]|nr:hypothetical protein [Armatimonadota bacterium]